MQVFYEEESFVLFLQGGHGLSEDQIHQIQNDVMTFVSGLRNGRARAAVQIHPKTDDCDKIKN